MFICLPPGHPRCRWLCFFSRTFTFYIYAFSRHFYPKRLTLHSSYSFTFYQLLLSLGIEPMILALLAPCSTIWATGKHVAQTQTKIFLTQTVAVCQSYNDSQWDPRLWESIKTYTDKNKLNDLSRVYVTHCLYSSLMSIQFLVQTDCFVS